MLDHRVFLKDSFDRICGLHVYDLKVQKDDRGALVELWRRSWQDASDLKQWNWVRSEANALRGVHLHVRHDDYLIAIEGEMLLGLHDARRGSGSFGASAVLTLSSDAPCAVQIPVGVAHGFYFKERGAYLYGLSEGWSMQDEFGCAWDDPALNLTWPVLDPLLSPQDAEAGSFDDMVRGYEVARRRG